MVPQSIENLIHLGILIKDDEDECYVSYVVAEDYVIQVTAQCNDEKATANYFQLSLLNEDKNWVVQLERFYDDPNHYEQDQLVDFKVFKLVP